MQCKIRYHVLAMLALLIGGSASADERFRLPIESVELRPGWRHADEAGDVHVVGIHLQLLDEWKTFWRTPGSVGLPPRMDWSNSRNLKSAEIFWPVPRVFKEGDSSFFGYEKEVVFPVGLRPVNPGEDISVLVDFEFAVCNEICIPTDATLSAKLPAQDVIPDPVLVETLDELRANFRVGDPDEIPRCRFKASEYGHEVALEYELPPEGQQVAHLVLEYSDGLFQFEEAELRRGADGIVATSFMHYYGEGAVAIDRSAIRSTVLFDGKAVEFRGCAVS